MSTSKSSNDKAKDEATSDTQTAAATGAINPPLDVAQNDHVPDVEDSGGRHHHPSEGDLVIRDGFPALHEAGIKPYRPLWKGKEPPIPQHTFWSHPHAIFFATQHLDTLRHDCEVVFTARDKPDGAAYSAGQTYFIPSNMKPRCALEALALLIFKQHTQHLPEGTFNPCNSGANWWTLVMDEKSTRRDEGSISKQDHDDDDDDDDADEEDEVGLHFDADYELEEQTTNILLHPRVGTVTYLSDHGAPTAIFDLKSPPMDDAKRKSLEQPIKTIWLSHPQLGKHTAFDGRLLHGAPALYFPSLSTITETTSSLHNHHEGSTTTPSSTSSSLQPQPNAKRQKIEDTTPTPTTTATKTSSNSRTTNPSNNINQNRKRYTLLVNVWLNHWVMDAALLDDDVCAQLKTPCWEEEATTGATDADNQHGHQHNNVTQEDVTRIKDVDGDSGAGDVVVPQTPPFTWNPNIDLSQPTTTTGGMLASTTLQPSLVDPAGEDEIMLCNHHVTVHYNPLMGDCHAASHLAPTVQVQLAPNTIQLKVGDMVLESIA